MIVWVVVRCPLELAPTQRALWREQTALALAAVEAAGVTVVRPDKQLFQRQVTDLHGEYQGTTIGDLITAIREVQNDAH